MEWNNSHKNPPNVNQKVYYFGPYIGIGIGHYYNESGRSFYPYYYDEQGEKQYDYKKKVELCPHIFQNINFGTVDACDAPYWLPYDEERAKSWCPIIPEQYTKDLYD